MIGQLVNFGGGIEFKPKTNRALIYSLFTAALYGKTIQLENQKLFWTLNNPLYVGIILSYRIYIIIL